MASSKAVHGLKHVKPILSMNHNEAKTRVLNLYRAWHRQLPYICEDYDLQLNIPTLQAKLREEFMKNQNVNDVRVIDMLCIKGGQELDEIKKIHKQRNHVMAYFKDSPQENKPKDFLSKFYDGHNP